MVNVNDDVRGDEYCRVEVLTQPGRRRKWSDDDKARIVVELARRRRVCPQQVFTWRRDMRDGAAALDFLRIQPLRTVDRRIVKFSFV